MATSEQVLPDGLVVMRQQIDPDIVPEMTRELSTICDTLGPFGFDFDRASEICPIAKRAMVAASVPANSELFVNRQDPFEEPIFHRDYKFATILHPDGFGAFDYIDDGVTKTIEVEPGDIVSHSLRMLLHRGRNRGTNARYNLVCFYG